MKLQWSSALYCLEFKQGLVYAFNQPGGKKKKKIITRFPWWIASFISLWKVLNCGLIPNVVCKKFKLLYYCLMYHLTHIIFVWVQLYLLAAICMCLYWFLLLFFFFLPSEEINSSIFSLRPRCFLHKFLYMHAYIYKFISFFFNNLGALCSIFVYVHIQLHLLAETHFYALI